MPTRWEVHEKKWSSCTNCELCETRRSVVLYRGKIPCDLLFVGEAPGFRENDLGQPFVGPAGQLLDKIVASAEVMEIFPRLGFTNLVSCIPIDPHGDNAKKFTEPHKDHIKACRERLEEIVEIASPKAFCFVGKLAEKYGLDLAEDRPYASMIHPAAILRKPTGRNFLIQQSIIKLLDLKEAFNG